MEAAIKLIELNGVIRTAIRMIRGVELKLTDSTFEFAVFSIFPWFKVSTHTCTGSMIDGHRHC